MRRAFLAVSALLALAFFAPAASAAQYNGMTMGASPGYLREGFNDTIVLTLQLTEESVPAGIANVPVALKFLTGEEYVIFGNQLIITNATGAGTATIMLNPDNQPENWRLPVQVMIEAITTDNDGTRCNAIVYITSTGSITGFVVDDDMSTITGARITVQMPDGQTFNGGPYTSSDGSGSQMGRYQIYNLPVELPGKYTLTAEKNGFSGTIKATATSSYDDIRQDIIIHGYKDNTVPVVSGTANASPTVTPTANPTADTPTKPTTMTTTIIVAIALIALVYIGLKAYRRMF